MPRTIEAQIMATYFALRAGAAAIAFVFPLVYGEVASSPARRPVSGRGQ
jgi:hypothetical protein